MRGLHHCFYSRQVYSLLESCQNCLIKDRIKAVFLRNHCSNKHLSRLDKSIEPRLKSKKRNVRGSGGERRDSIIARALKRKSQHHVNKYAITDLPILIFFLRCTSYTERRPRRDGRGEIASRFFRWIVEEVFLARCVGLYLPIFYITKKENICLNNSNQVEPIQFQDCI